uniref:Uncharacterized protein n=1 Tax=Chromera velia CCMP2878 TaxID=1169474 RepID=A0A0G4I3K4_9ALVE|mmetsp:Transcript_33000/g.65361  ORF Transcript_33000/g.65361 Transcript_33000/m.65361 type:complete len:311 (-) Transcript_33000:554-1486(-)|eukprot:Cvel_10654.t1-p1 / transcript=Cvel_10654.t1 / gene=Cvel_10654 / organism=Chromera_velia_CCMP2878 / gene_product=hypothetical protein / transcript_product=hypothetical protein / location=Cvel_scaffold647:50774-52395(-) / protein_length=310 / sequence_SO=supercontig / SO=protein_coding / is_pseudo=false
MKLLTVALSTVATQAALDGIKLGDLGLGKFNLSDSMLDPKLKLDFGLGGGDSFELGNLFGKTEKKGKQCFDECVTTAEGITWVGIKTDEANSTNNVLTVTQGFENCGHDIEGTLLESVTSLPPPEYNSANPRPTTLFTEQDKSSVLLKSFLTESFPGTIASDLGFFSWIVSTEGTLISLVSPQSDQTSRTVEFFLNGCNNEEAITGSVSCVLGNPGGNGSLFPLTEVALPSSFFDFSVSPTESDKKKESDVFVANVTVTDVSATSNFCGSQTSMDFPVVIGTSFQIEGCCGAAAFYEGFFPLDSGNSGSR